MFFGDSDTHLAKVAGDPTFLIKLLLQPCFVGFYNNRLTSSPRGRPSRQITTAKLACGAGAALEGAPLEDTCPPSLGVGTDEATFFQQEAQGFPPPRAYQDTGGDWLLGGEPRSAGDIPARPILTELMYRSWVHPFRRPSKSLVGGDGAGWLVYHLRRTQTGRCNAWTAGRITRVARHRLRNEFLPAGKEPRILRTNGAARNIRRRSYRAQNSVVGESWHS
jgi:hypothetical protein